MSGQDKIGPQKSQEQTRQPSIESSPTTKRITPARNLIATELNEDLGDPKGMFDDRLI